MTLSKLFHSYVLFTPARWAYVNRDKKDRGKGKLSRKIACKSVSILEHAKRKSHCSIPKSYIRTHDALNF